MKFFVAYRERRGGPAAGQPVIARLASGRALPAGLKLRELLSRVGGGGGYAVVEATDAADLQHLAELLAAYDCRIEPVVDVPIAAVARSAAGASGRAPGEPVNRLPEMPPSEPHEGAFSDDDVYDTED